jgi:hypothetical protein
MEELTELSSDRSLKKKKKKLAVNSEKVPKTEWNSSAVTKLPLSSPGSYR